MIQLADIALASPSTATITPYLPADEPIHLTHNERMRLYTTGWFDLVCFGLLILLCCFALFA